MHNFDEFFEDLLLGKSNLNVYMNVRVSGAGLTMTIFGKQV